MRGFLGPEGPGNTTARLERPGAHALHHAAREEGTMRRCALGVTSAGHAHRADGQCQPRTQHSRVGMLRQNNQHTPARAAVLAAMLRHTASLSDVFFLIKMI